MLLNTHTIKGSSKFFMVIQGISELKSVSTHLGAGTLKETENLQPTWNYKV